MDRKKIPLLVLCILIAAVFWLVPTPVGLEDNSWHFLGLFIAVIMAVILQVMPFIAIAIVALSGYYHYPIENLSKIYTKATSKTSTQQLIDETKISFSLSMMILLFKDFIEYKQNKEIQNKNFIIQEEISKLKQDKQKLLTNIQDLNFTLSNKISSTQQQFHILSTITKEINLDKNKAIILNQIISWLNSNELKITNLEFEQTKIILSFIDENHFKRALENLNSTFKFLDKNEETLNIILEVIHE